MSADEEETISISTTNEELVRKGFDPVVVLKKSNILTLSSSCPDNNKELLGDAKFVDKIARRFYIIARRNVKKRTKLFSSTSESLPYDEDPENDESDF